MSCHTNHSLLHLLKQTKITIQNLILHSGGYRHDVEHDQCTKFPLWQELTFQNWYVLYQDIQNFYIQNFIIQILQNNLHLAPQNMQAIGNVSGTKTITLVIAFRGIWLLLRYDRQLNCHGRNLGKTEKTHVPTVNRSVKDVVCDL